MVLSNGETYFSIDLESRVLVHKDNIWRLKRVLKWEENLTMVEAFVKIGIFGALDSKVPGVDVVL